jgi:NADPH2:quinone reductase
VLPIPDTISDQAAAALTLNYGTAYAALHHFARVRPGETILIHAAAAGWAPPPSSWPGWSRAPA